MSTPRYPEYKDSGVAWLGEVPAHWEIARLKRSFALVTDRAEQHTNPVALENVDGWSGRFIPTEAEFQGEGIAFEAGDILFGKLRPYLAKVLLADRVGEAVGDFHVLRPANGVVPHFAQLQMLTRAFIDTVDGSTFGSKMPRASWDFLGAMPFVLPSVAEQAAIAAFLDRETARIDALIAEQEKLIALLKEKRQALISHAVTKGLDPNAPMKDSGIEWLGQVPAHWNISRLGAIFREASDVGNDDLPILSVSIHDGVSDKELDEAEMDRKVTRSEDRSKYKAVQPDDLAYNMMRAWQGGFGAVTVAGQVSPAYVVARPIGEVCTPFIEQLLRTPQAVEQMRRHSRGVTDFRLRLYWEEFKNIRVALPTLPEQHAILDAVAIETKKFDLLVEEAVDAIELLKEHRAALISAAVTGKIDVRNAS